MRWFPFWVLLDSFGDLVVKYKYEATQKYPNGLNMYAYCFNNPINASDADGDIPKWLKWLLGGLAFIGAVILTAVSGGAMAPVFIGMGVSILGGD